MLRERTPARCDCVFSSSLRTVCGLAANPRGFNHVRGRIAEGTLNAFSAFGSDGQP